MSRRQWRKMEKNKNDFCIISYATTGTPYEEVIENYLMKSLSKFSSLCYSYKIVPNLGNWNANSAYKSKFILEMFDELSTYDSLVFTDADSTFEKFPQLFYDIPKEYDMALHCFSWESHYGRPSDKDKFETLSGTMFLRNNNKVKRLLKDWSQRAQKTTQWEQKILGIVLKMPQHSNLNIYNLPREYSYVISQPNGDKPKVEIKEPVIKHHQLSRIYKRFLR